MLLYFGGGWKRYGRPKREETEDLTTTAGCFSWSAGGGDLVGWRRRLGWAATATWLGGGVAAAAGTRAAAVCAAAAAPLLAAAAGGQLCVLLAGEGRRAGSSCAPCSGILQLITRGKLENVITLLKMDLERF